ncbi:MAG: hypothetical protein ACJA13_003034, partial [Paraglaciecola sp.]
YGHFKNGMMFKPKAAELSNAIRCPIDPNLASSRSSAP